MGIYYVYTSKSLYIHYAIVKHLLCRSKSMESYAPSVDTWGAVVLGNGVVEEAVVWQDSTQTYRLQLNTILNTILLV